VKRSLEAAGRRIARSNRRMIETQWTRDEAVAWAREQFELKARWPARRFRVEGGGSVTRACSARAPRAARPLATGAASWS
jgi:hypothetical protein